MVELNDGHNMETFYSFADQIEAPDEPPEELTTNFQSMVSAIIQQRPDPKLLPDYDE